jgi:hypothetical protein
MIIVLAEMAIIACSPILTLDDTHQFLMAVMELVGLAAAASQPPSGGIEP